MLNLIIKLREHIKLLFHPVIINAFVFYDERGRVRKENWGDDINYYFLRDIVKRPLVLVNRTSLAFRLELRNYLVIGSTIDMLCRRNTEVWGAGIIDGSKPLQMKPTKVHAVRGPLTRNKLLAEGVDCPEIYGDPALLTALYYRPNITRRCKYGIISHVSNLALLENMLIEGEPLSQCEDVLIINMRQYVHWHDIIDQVCACEAILSSSLHGLIIAEAYRIPNVWIEFGKPLIGGHFKFHDFFLSIQRDRTAPVSIVGNTLPLQEIEHEINDWNPGIINLQPLFKSCPFELKKAKYDL